MLSFCLGSTGLNWRPIPLSGAPRYITLPRTGTILGGLKLHPPDVPSTKARAHKAAARRPPKTQRMAPPCQSVNGRRQHLAAVEAQQRSHGRRLKPVAEGAHAAVGHGELAVAGVGRAPVVGEVHAGGVLKDAGAVAAVAAVIAGEERLVPA